MTVFKLRILNSRKQIWLLPLTKMVRSVGFRREKTVQTVTWLSGLNTDKYFVTLVVLALVRWTNLLRIYQLKIFVVPVLTLRSTQPSTLRGTVN